MAIFSAVRLRGYATGLGALGALLAARPGLATGLEAEFEAGVVFVGRNEARVPGNGGTMLSLADDLTLPPAPVFRLRAGYRLGERHLITALYAPLQVNARGSVGRDINFDGGLYPAGTPLLAVYRFNSYRLTYRYSFIRRAGWELAAGVTGKIRDAEVSLYGAEARRKTNVGFVPLLNVHVSWRPGDSRCGLVLDADALAAPQGRAEDVLLAGTCTVRDGLDVRLGYRTVEGGADNDEVYNFAWLHYVVAALVITR